MLIPENKLWRAVLQQAYEDAELWVDTADDGPDSLERTLARRYLRADGPGEAAGLRLICDFADVPADRVISWARKRYPLAA